MPIRALTVLLGLIGAGWTALALPSFQAIAPYEGLARQIVVGEVFKDDVLVGAVARLEASAAETLRQPARSRIYAILCTRLVESALDRVAGLQIDQRMAALRAAIDVALKESPADPFLWLILYWLTNTQNGVAPQNLAYLTTSYALGPREGWIAIRRNRFGLATFQQLENVTQDFVVAEFSAMLEARLFVEATTNLAGVGWPIRDRLVAELAKMDTISRDAFAKHIYGQGIDLQIPGARVMGDRPWR